MPNPGPRSLVPARIAAVAVTVTGAVQAALAAVFLSDAAHTDVLAVHRIVGMTTIVIAVVAALICYRGARASRPTAALLAITLAVVAVVQVGLGEAHLQMIHIVLGCAFLAGAVWLLADLFRRGSAR